MISSKAILSLLNLPGYGNKKVMKIIFSTLKTQSITTDTLIDDISMFVEDGEQAREAVQKADDTIKKSQDAEINVVGYFDELYPERLRTIPDPPPVLHSKGNLKGLSETCVALIGTRTPSDYTKRSVRKIGKLLAEANCTVVSGLALGCDTEGHLGCLEGNGTTVAILAHGLQKISPSSNNYLADKIIDLGGCVLSEYIIDTEPQRGLYVQRNRIQSGLSDAVILAQSGLQGGSMRTVEFAEKQDRDLYCISQTDTLNTEGNRLLIQTGRATPLNSKTDIEKLVDKIAAHSSAPLFEPEQKQLHFE